jgi:predicted peroxiredoxin
VMPSSVARSNLNKLLASYAPLDMNQIQSQDLHEQLKIMSIAVFKNLLLDSSEALEYVLLFG